MNFFKYFNYENFKTKNSGEIAKLEIVPATVEELNAELIRHGLEPYSEELRVVVEEDLDGL